MCNVCTALMICRVCTAPIIHNILPVLSRCSSVINRVHCASPAPTSRPISWANLIKDTKKASKGSSFFPYFHLSFFVNKWYFLLNKGSQKENATRPRGFCSSFSESPERRQTTWGQEGVRRKVELRSSALGGIAGKAERSLAPKGNEGLPLIITASLRIGKVTIQCGSVYYSRLLRWRLFTCSSRDLNLSLLMFAFHEKKMANH